MNIEFKVFPWGDLSSTDYTSSDFKIVVLVDGEDAGYGCFYHENFQIYCQEVEVYPKFQRQGVATKMYNHAERIAQKSVAPTGDINTGLNSSGEDSLSSEGQAFWKKRRSNK